MKRSFITLLLLLSLSFIFAQNREADSLHRLLDAAHTSHEKVDLLCSLSFVYVDYKPDSALLLAQKAWFISKNDKYQRGESLALGHMAAAYKSLGNFPKSLEHYIEKLKIEEERGSSTQLTVVYLAMASLYDDSKDFDKGLLYAKKADSIIRDSRVVPATKPDSVIKQLQLYAPYSLLNLGDIFEKTNRLDSALAYTEECLRISRQAGNDLLIGTSLNNLGNIYRKLGSDSLALANYHAAIAYELSSDNYSTYTETTLGLARVFDKQGLADSAFHYGKQSFAIASANRFTVRALNASIFLSELYKAKKNVDSAFAYQEVVVSLKDTVESTEKIRELQIITTAEQVRQAELEEAKLEQIEERRQKLQLLVVGIMIPIFFLLSVVISRRKVHKRLIEFMGIVSVLMFFEYITLLLHPFIAEKSHHSPIIEIIIFVAIAAVITPAHHKIQHWLISKLHDYNYLKHHKPKDDPQKNITEQDPGTPLPGSVIE